MPPTDNLLFYGDNLDVLRRHVKDETVDLVYLDPPFNSSRNYNVLFDAKDGTEAAAQIQAFEDTWSYDEAAARQFHETVEQGGRVADVMVAFQQFLGTNDMLAYLAMMAPRLIELRRVLKDTGSLYLHCDPTASHYLKLLLDAVFGPAQFRNEIVWKRASTVKGNFGQGTKFWDRNSDSILFYTKGDESTFNQLFTPYTEAYIETAYRYIEPGTGRRYRLVSMIGPGGAAKGNPYYEVMGVSRFWRYSREKMQALIEAGLVVQPSPGTVPHRKYYLDEGKGVPIQSVWADIGNLQASDAERLGYPTQKPESLLERIILASTNPGDTVLDPFCGCGTTVAAAERLKRRWIGIDVTHLAIGLIKSRLETAYAGAAKYKVIGEPTTVDGAARLAKDEPFQFQAWATGLVGARTAAEAQKGADKGIDGRLRFRYAADDTYKQVVISVKAGKLHATYVRDLRGVIEREKAAIGALISFDEPTRKMREEAASAGFFSTPWGDFPRLQLLTIEEILAGKGIEYPRVTGMNQTFKPAPRVVPKDSHALPLAGDMAPEKDHVPGRRLKPPRKDRKR